jgi:hypothetical protein
MALPQDERVMQLRRLARQLEVSSPSPERDELLSRTRLRVVELEASEDLDPPSSIPALERWDLTRQPRGTGRTISLTGD